MNKPNWILMAFTPYFTGFAWGIYREFSYRNSGTVCLKFRKKISELKLMFVCRTVISWSVPATEFLHSLSSSPCGSTYFILLSVLKAQRFHLCDILLPLHYIPGRNADGLASHPEQKLTSSQTHEIYSNC